MNKQAKEKKEKLSFSFSNLFKYLTVALLFILALVTLFNRGPIAEFFTFINVYLLGVFFFIVPLVEIFAGVMILVPHHKLDKKTFFMVLSGLFILLLSLLIFTSLSSNPTIYNGKDDPNYFISLFNSNINALGDGKAAQASYSSSILRTGGGFFGYFLTSLFTVGSNLGLAIFIGILLLLGGLTLICIRPVLFILNRKTNKKAQIPQGANDGTVVNSSIPQANQVNNQFNPVNQNPMMNNPQMFYPNNGQDLNGNYYNQNYQNHYNPQNPLQQQNLNIPNFNQANQINQTNQPIQQNINDNTIEATKQAKSTKKKEVIEENKPEFVLSDVETFGQTTYQEEIITEESPKKPVFSRFKKEKNGEEITNQNIVIKEEKEEVDENLKEEKLEKVFDQREVINHEAFPKEEKKGFFSRFKSSNNNDQVQKEEVIEDKQKESNISSNFSDSILESNSNDYKYDDDPFAVDDPSINIPKPQKPIEPNPKSFASAEKMTREELYQKRFPNDVIVDLGNPKEEIKETKINTMSGNDDYILPPISLLEDHAEYGKVEINNRSNYEKQKKINQFFQDYKIDAQVETFTLGSSVTRFNIRMKPGSRIKDITSRLQELQLNLRGDKSVRVEGVVEGRDTSGIEIGNEEPTMVSFKKCYNQLFSSNERLAVAIGTNIDGDVVSVSLDSLPHILIAGTTGSGKSVFVHSLIMTLIMRNYPNQMKLILIDPKKVEFTKYKDIPHLFCRIVNDIKQSTLILNELVNEMERRYTLLSSANCVNLKEYRQRCQTNKSLVDMPDLVCVIDEFADLIAQDPDSVETSVQRLAQKARACGIYLVIATQRPSVKVITGDIKANIPARVALTVSSQVDSRTIIDEVGAETLVGKGDLLARLPGHKSLVRCQSCYVSNDEITRVTTYLTKVGGKPTFDSRFTSIQQAFEIEKGDE